MGLPHIVECGRTHARVWEDSRAHPSFVPSPCASISIQVTAQEALTLWYVRTHASPIHPRGGLTLGQWDEGTVFCQVVTGFSPRLGLWPRRVLLGTMGTWKHMDRTWREEGWTGMGAVWLCQRGASWHRPSLPDGSEYFLGAWAAPWQGKLGPSLAVGSQDLSQMRRIRGCPALGSSTDVLKSKEDPFEGAAWRGPCFLRVGWGEVCSWPVVPGRGERAAQASCPDSNLARPS